jgi:hypothetical protein
MGRRPFSFLEMAVAVYKHGVGVLAADDWEITWRGRVVGLVPKVFDDEGKPTNIADAWRSAAMRDYHRNKDRRSHAGLVKDRT